MKTVLILLTFLYSCSKENITPTQHIDFWETNCAINGDTVYVDSSNVVDFGFVRLENINTYELEFSLNPYFTKDVISANKIPKEHKNITLENNCKYIINTYTFSDLKQFDKVRIWWRISHNNIHSDIRCLYLKY